jgi:peptide deformylase
MALLSVRHYPDPVLMKKAIPVEGLTQETLTLISNMKETMKGHKGVGLAAPQVGVSRRIIVVLFDEEQEPLAFLNPKIVSFSKEKEKDEEGCLSIMPKHIHIPVSRHIRVQVHALDEQGKEVTINAKGLIARIFQHEIDHLNGILILHRGGWYQRFKNRKYLSQLKKEYARAHA